ncbi:trypco2 family protein [Glycomyces buryatensis]|uniref:Trypsin-co-occurring domain-containing protein n=1 Tax=Glycomyces buryatensis TaxID=2570927 RepID=A0A4S8QHL5_9ACTN|nr:trypco2 family protein [Glycomyces buryatensis]THV42455.1 hypothetical protein FAB82_06160 [Glycomyces buryatensis]
MSNSLPLSDALAHLRDELRDARLQADDELKLNITSIQLDLALEVHTGVGAEAGASFWRVVTAKASADRVTDRVHRLTMTIEPSIVDASSGDEREFAVSPRKPIPDRD